MMASIVIADFDNRFHSANKTVAHVAAFRISNKPTCCSAEQSFSGLEKEEQFRIVDAEHVWKDSDSHPRELHATSGSGYVRQRVECTSCCFEMYIKTKRHEISAKP